VKFFRVPLRCSIFGTNINKLKQYCEETKELDIKDEDLISIKKS